MPPDSKPDRTPHQTAEPPSSRASTAARDSQLAIDVCPHCSETVNLALIKGCLRCMKCGFKWDCNGW